MSLKESDVRDFMALGREQVGVEFKSAGARTEGPLKARVVRAMLAMANRRDGGTVIIGVKENANQLALDGLTDAQLQTWRHDYIADTVAEYADPRVSFDSHTIVLDGHSLVVMQVREFADMPVICKRGFSEGNKVILRDGAIYVRSNRKPESREVANYDEMRELIENATDRGVRRFVVRAQQAGMVIGGLPTRAADAEYKRERGDL